MRYSVLANAAGDRVLVGGVPHEDAARRCGFSQQVWVGEAIDYREAYQHWTMVGEDPVNVNVAGAVNPPELGLDSLTPPELDAVRDLVHALVVHDRDALEAAGAYDGHDPYRWTAPHGRWEHVDLMLPPGPTGTWRGDVVRVESLPGWAGVVVDLWTLQEGPSDLSLELELATDGDGSVAATFQTLHVL